MRFRDFKLERYFARYEFEVPYLLCASDCETVAVDDLFGLDPGYREGMAALRLGYTESPGHPALREEISRIYETISPEDVIVFSGAEEAIFAFMTGLLEQGDTVAATFPGYQSLYSLAEDRGVKVRRIELDESDGWKLDTEAFGRPEGGRLKAIVVNFPHNPTGAMISRSVLEELCETAVAHGAYLFSDEVYRWSEYRRDDLLPAACDLYERGISLGVLSKSLGLAGLRIGWIATRDNEVRQVVQRVKDFTTICASAPSEYLATIALRHREKLLQRNRGILQENLTRLEQFMAGHGDMFSWNPPQAGPVAFPRVHAVEGVEAFCADLAETAGVLLLPSTVYEYGNAHVRIGFGRANFADGLDRLVNYLNQRKA